MRGLIFEGTKFDELINIKMKGGSFAETKSLEKSISLLKCHRLMKYRNHRVIRQLKVHDERDDDDVY